MMRLKYDRQCGLSIVELMVAITISLILLAGVSQIFLGTRQSARLNENMAHIQETGRFAMELMGRDIRQAGYRGGCLPGVDMGNLLDPSGVGYDAAMQSFADGMDVRGWDDQAGDYAANMNGYMAGTDVIYLRHAAIASGATASGNTPANANTINLNGSSGIQQCSIVIVSDMEGCDMFQNRSNPNASTLTRGAGGGCDPGNLNPGANNFSKAYDSSMEIMLLTSSIYYVGASVNPNQSALRRLRFNQGTVIDDELVDGVLDMQIVYGIDTSGDRAANRYVSAAELGDQAAVTAGTAFWHWNNVVSARINLLAVGTDQNMVDVNQIVQLNEINVAVPNRRLARVFTSTIGIRNRLP